MPIDTGVSDDFIIINIRTHIHLYIIIGIFECLWGISATYADNKFTSIIIINLMHKYTRNIWHTWYHQGEYPPTYVKGVPGGGTYPLFIANSSIFKKNSGKNFMRNIKPPQYPRMKSAIYILYRGGIIIAYRIHHMLEEC